MSDGVDLSVNTRESSHPEASAERVRRRLVVLLGESPAVLTETVWALLHEEPAWIPDEIYAVTSLVGEKIACDSDLPLQSSLEDLWLCVRSPRDRQPQIDLPGVCPTIEFPSIGRSDVADFGDLKSLSWLYVVLGKILDRNTPRKAVKTAMGDRIEVHLSVSGGRKAQGALATIVAQSFWQAGDRMSQVMVLPNDVERAAGFDRFRFPGEREQIFWVGANSGDRSAVRSNMVEIRLVDIPVLPSAPSLVQVRDLLPLPDEPEVHDGKLDYSVFYQRARRYYEMSWAGEIQLKVVLANRLKDCYIELLLKDSQNFAARILARDRRTEEVLGLGPAYMVVSPAQFAYLVWAATIPSKTAREDLREEVLSAQNLRYFVLQTWALGSKDQTTLCQVIEKERLDLSDAHDQAKALHKIKYETRGRTKQKRDVKVELRKAFGLLGEKILDQLDRVGDEISCRPEFSDEMIGSYDLLLSWP